MSEHTEQCKIFEWAEGQCDPRLNLLNSSLNGARLTPGQAKKMSNAGMKKGFPDIFLPVPIGDYAGLFVELKIGKNKPSKAQRLWIAALNNMGYYAVVCYGADEAIKTIKEYLGDDKNRMDQGGNHKRSSLPRHDGNTGFWYRGDCADIQTDKSAHL